MDEEFYVDAITRVFWDVEDFRIGSIRELSLLPRNVETAIENLGYLGEVDIWAYGAKKPVDEVNDYRRTGIMFVKKADDKLVRLNQMLLDMVYFAYLNPHSEFPLREKNFLVISKDVPQGDTEFFSVIQKLRKRGYNVFLAVPDDCPPEEVPDADLVWRWSNLMEGAFPIESYSEDSEDD